MTNTDETPKAAPSKLKKRAGQAWRLYGWWGRFKNANAIVKFIVGLLQSKAGGTVAFALLGGAATVGAINVAKPDLLRGWLLPKNTVDVSTQKWGDNSVVFPVDGVDKAGRRASFDVLVLTKEFTWVRGSAGLVVKGDVALTDADIASTVFTPDVRNGLGRSPDVIAVGVASQEGVANIEKDRALKRSETAARWLAGAMPGETRIWKLTLGQYQLACATPDAADTSWQRPLMIIGVRWQDKDANIPEALADAMTGKSNVPSPACYSDFAMSRFR